MRSELWKVALKTRTVSRSFNSTNNEINWQRYQQKIVEIRQITLLDPNFFFQFNHKNVKYPDIFPKKRQTSTNCMPEKVFICIIRS